MGEHHASQAMEHSSWGILGKTYEALEVATGKHSQLAGVAYLTLGRSRNKEISTYRAQSCLAFGGWLTGSRSPAPSKSKSSYEIFHKLKWHKASCILSFPKVPVILYFSKRPTLIPFFANKKKCQGEFCFYRCTNVGLLEKQTVVTQNFQKVGDTCTLHFWVSGQAGHLQEH